MAYKQERSEINNLSLHLKKLYKEEQTKPQTSRKKKLIIKVSVNINKIENKNNREKSIKSQSGYLKRSIKLTNPYL